MCFLFKFREELLKYILNTCVFCDLNYSNLKLVLRCICIIYIIPACWGRLASLLPPMAA